ncbi:HD-GYP domain-containing protein [Streptomyces sp. NPDC002553]|uniref:HD-GYP domain-containing protein n=1 Tax=Streptomyces sp. NPDC002553 TaxID=3154417 RepID=UPI003334805D
MEAVPARARGYVVCAAFGALLCLTPPPLAWTPWWTVLPLAALYAGGERIARRRFAGAFYPVLLAGAFLLPPSAAALVPLPGALCSPDGRRPSPLRRIRRAAHLATGVWAAAWVHRALGGAEAVVDADLPAALAPAGAAVFVFCLVLAAADGGMPVPRQATFAPSRRPALPRRGDPRLAAPAESPSTSSTRTSGRHAESTHRSDTAAPRRALLHGRTSPAAAQAPAERLPPRPPARGLFLRSLAPVGVHGLAGLMMALLWRSPYGPVAALLVLFPMGVSWWVFAQYHQERTAHQATIRALVQAVDIKDGYTRGHSERVGQASMMIARELGMDEQRVETLRFAGILHDVGKLGVPTRLLRKNGPLTPEERRVIELHPEYGHEITRGIAFLGEARSAILHHHERMDGNGYPYGLAGAQIPESARVVAVADAFDAMTSTRSYSRARPVAAALEELNRCAGEHFDPRMVSALTEVITREGWHPVVTADTPHPPQQQPSPPSAVDTASTTTTSPAPVPAPGRSGAPQTESR